MNTMTAIYDNKPSVFEALGNGGCLYRWDIKKADAPEGPFADSGQRTQWRCSEVVVRPPVTSDSVTKAVIASLWSLNHEQKLINEYNEAMLGFCAEEEAASKIAAYKGFLEARIAIKLQIDRDFNKNQINDQEDEEDYQLDE